MSTFVAVIMAGGKGQRFWPLSTPDKPKQFLDLERSGRTLIQSTYDRILPLVEGPEAIFVATAEPYKELVLQQLPELSEENLIIEPVGRDSAPAVALASLTLHKRYPNAIAGFFSADHRIGLPDVFRDTIRQATKLAKTTAGIVTIGIQPQWAATGYGYIQAGEPFGEHGYRVLQFVEKPNSEKARQYLEAGSYSWNAGIFVWPLKAILHELETHVPELMTPLRKAFKDGKIDEVFPTLTKISIDYAVMEQAEQVYVIPGDFEWDDIGDWVALERLLKQNDGASNTVVGNHVGLETAGNIIYTETGDDVIVTLGVENLVVVKRGNVVMLVHKDRIQEIKHILEDERLASISVG